MAKNRLLCQLLSLIVLTMPPSLQAKQCTSQVRDIMMPDIYEKTKFYATIYSFGETVEKESCTIDFGTHLNHTEKDETSVFFLVVKCKMSRMISLRNRFNVTRKNVVSYLQVVGSCQVGLQDVGSFAKATDYRVHTLMRGAQMSANNSSQEQENLEAIQNVGTLTLESSTQDGIPEMFVNMTWPWMAEVMFVNLSIKSFPVKLRYSMPRLQSLQLNNNYLTVPPAFPWDDQVLYLPRNLSRKAPFNHQYEELTTVKPNVYRRFFDLDFNKIRDLSRHQFRGFIQRISIRGNGLHTLNENCFVNLTGTNVIDLSLNELTELPRGVFRELSQLRELRLNNNSISVIFGDAFRDSVNLKTLYLQHNKLKRLPSGLLLDHVNLNELHLENNMLGRIEHGVLPNNSNKMKNLYLNHNKLTTIPDAVFLTRSLKAATLANNSITFKGIIETLDSIYLGHLSYALRRSVSTLSRDLKGETIFLDLSGNNIRHIDVTGLDREQMTKLVMILSVFEINLKDNELVCDCETLHLSRLLRKLIGNNVEERHFKSWICASPASLAGTPVLEVPARDFVCVRNFTGCPSNSTCSVRETDGSVIVDSRNKHLTELPQTMPSGKELEILLDGNEITELNMRGYLGNVSILHLSRNKIRQLNDSFLNEVTKIRELRIDSNELRRLPRSVEMLTSRKSFVTLAIHSNYLLCDCHDRWMKSWLRNSQDKIYDINNVKCSSGTLQGKAIYSASLDEFICEKEEKGSIVTAQHDNKHIVIAAILLAVTLAMTITITVLVHCFKGEMKVFVYTHFNWHPFDRVDDSDHCKIYDAFISYNNQDRDWVLRELKEKLEEHDPPYRICLHDRDFEVGATIHENIINSVNQSKRMIMILSKSFLQSEWCMLEFRTAHQKVLQDKTNYLIIILFEDVDTDNVDDETKLYLRTNTYLEKNNKWFWQKLLYALPKPRLESDNGALNKSDTIVNVPALDVDGEGTSARTDDTRV